MQKFLKKIKFCTRRQRLPHAFTLIVIVAVILLLEVVPTVLVAVALLLALVLAVALEESVADPFGRVDALLGNVLNASPARTGTQASQPEVLARGALEGLGGADVAVEKDVDLAVSSLCSDLIDRNTGHRGSSGVSGT